MSRRVLRILTPLFVLISVCSAYGQATPTPTPKDAIDEYSLVHIGDVVDIDFVGGVEYDWRGPVTPDGFLDAFDAVAGRIPAVCRSEADLAAELEKAFAKILRAPKVRVSIIDRSNRALVRLDGAVRTPTRFRVLRPVRLRELIVLAGGFTDAASGNITWYRPPDLNCSTRSSARGPQDNGIQIATIKISDLLTGNARADIQVLGGDTVEVERAEPVYVIGAVASPRPVIMRHGLTVSRAVASAGGPTRDADGRVTMFRRQGPESVVTETHLMKIKRGEAGDAVLMPFDIIDVAGKGSRTRKFPPVTPSPSPEKRELPLRVID